MASSAIIFRMTPTAQPRPLLFLTNAAAVRAVKNGTTNPETGKRVGPGEHYTIQARPDLMRGECGRGTVWPLVPSGFALDDLHRGRMLMAEYQSAYLNGSAPLPTNRLTANDPHVESGMPRTFSAHIAPGRLMATTRSSTPTEVQHGDTLTCCCSAKAADAGQCHRVWAAWLLLGDGWDVVLDGRQIAPADRHQLLERSPEHPHTDPPKARKKRAAK